MDKRTRRLKIFKTSGSNRKGYARKGLLFAGRFPLGGFQRVHFFNGNLHLFPDHMGAQVAVAAGPFRFRVRAGDAKFPGGENLYAFAALAFFDDGIALPTVITAPLLGHEGAFHANFDYLTDHFSYLLKNESGPKT
jgi:hypothetical protein